MDNISLFGHVFTIDAIDGAPPTMEEREQLAKAISTIEGQRTILGDAVVDVAISAMRERLESLQGISRTPQIAQQRKQVTVLFADVSGFTAMSETMDHEEVSTVINSLWTRVDQAILGQGGRIDKHIGDAVMALFGAPTAREDDPERAVRAALQVQVAIESWKQEFVESGSPLQSKVLGLQLRIGINTGPALIGTVGTTAEYTAIGDTVNLASRIESAAPVGGVLIAHNTYRHVPGVFDLTPLDPVKVKGKRELIQVYRVNGIRPRSQRMTSRGVEGIQTPMVGRAGELQLLQSALETTSRQAKTQLLTVIGEAGAGKSRLLQEFMQCLAAYPQPVRVLHGRAMPDMARLPSALIRDVLSTAFEIQDSDRAAVAHEKLEKGIQGAVGSTAENSAAHFIGQLIGFDFSASPHLQGILGDARQIRDLAFHYLAELLAAWAQHQTVLLVLEDIHWADGATLDLLDYVLKNKPDLRVLVVCSTRAALFEHRADWAADSDRRSRLELRPLADDACRELVREILRNVPDLPPVLINMIVQKAEGSPFYIEELINVLIESEVIVDEGPSWHVELDRLQSLKVPATLTGLLQARLDTLAPDDRETLQQASVVGRVFWSSVLQLMQNPDSRRLQADAAIGQSLDTLRSKELIYQNPESAFADASEFLFKNAVLRDVTYESVLLRLRRIYHVQVAEGLIRLGGERVGEYAGRVGEHYEQAGELLRAAEWYMKAGRQAQVTYAPEAAASYYGKALRFYSGSLDPESVSRQLEIYQRFGDVLIWQARYPEAIENYRSMLAMATAHDDGAAQAQALLGTAFCLGSQGDHHGAMENALKAERVARHVNLPDQMARSVFAQGLARYRLGEAHEALAYAEKALAVNQELGNRTEMVRCLNLLGGAYLSLSRYGESEASWEKALALSKQLGDRRQGMDLLNNLGVIAEARGDYHTAFLRYQGALEIAREVGYRDGEIVFLTNRGGQQAALGNYAEAEADLLSAIEMTGKAGSWILPMTYYYLSDTLLKMDECERALEAGRMSLALARADGGPDLIGAAYRALAAVSKELRRAILIENGMPADQQPREAEDLFKESLRVLEEGNMDGERARTLREWARYELRGGHRERGLEMWKEAREIFLRLGAQMEVDRMAELPS